MEENQKQVLDIFEKHLRENFSIFCEKHGLENNSQHLLIYLIDRQLIAPATIRRYAVLREFDRIYALEKTPKSKTVALLADRFNISSRYIWSMIKYDQRSKLGDKNP